MGLKAVQWVQRGLIVFNEVKKSSEGLKRTLMGKGKGLKEF